MSESSAATLERVPSYKDHGNKVVVLPMPVRQESGPAPSRREKVFRHRPSKPLRPSLSAADVLALQRQLAGLRSNEPALSRPSAEASSVVQLSPVSRVETVERIEPSGQIETVKQIEPVQRLEPVKQTEPVKRLEPVGRIEPVSEVEQSSPDAAVQPLARQTQGERVAEPVADEPVTPEPVTQSLRLRRRGLISLALLALIAGSALFLFGRAQKPDSVAGTTVAGTATEAEGEALAGAETPSAAMQEEAARWKTAARRTSAKAEELSRELVTVKDENASLSRSVGILEAEALNLQTELLERELDVVSLNAELEAVTDRRVIYNITNVPIDAGGSSLIGTPEVYQEPERYDYSQSADSYSTTGQTNNAGVVTYDD